MEAPGFVGRTEPESVFSLLSDDNRVAILRTLWETEETISFSELYDNVDIKDSGQFNYHLDKLVGKFVDKNKDGYRLTEAGRQINGAIDAGAYTATGSMEPIPLDPSCRICGGERTLFYEDELLEVECDSCEVKAAFGVPPSVFAGRDRAEIPEIAGKYLLTAIYRLQRGFCTFCDGPVEHTVEPLETAPWESNSTTGDDIHLPVIQYVCHNCGAEPTSGLTVSLLHHPDVVTFYADHGINIREESLWRIATFNAEYEAIESIDPFRASATFHVEVDELTIVVDEQLETVAVEQ